MRSRYAAGSAGSSGSGVAAGGWVCMAAEGAVRRLPGIKVCPVVCQANLSTVVKKVAIYIEVQSYMFVELQVAYIVVKGWLLRSYPNIVNVIYEVVQALFEL